MPGEIDRRLALQQGGAMLLSAVLDPASGDPVGMTTYMNIDAVAPRVGDRLDLVCAARAADGA